MNLIRHSCQEGKYINPNTEKYWDNMLKSRKDLIFKSPIFLEKHKIIASKLKKISGKILDIGFGYGYLEEIIEKQNIDLLVYGIDISNYAVEFAKKSYKGNFKKSSIYKIPYKNIYFDCVAAIDVLEHLPKNKTDFALSQINRVLKVEGTLVVSVPLNESNNDRLANGHLRIYNSDLIKNELIKSSFKIEEEIYLSAFSNMYYFKNIINKFLKIRKSNLIILICKKK